ncbi:MAG TPA: hypothetical protein VF851_02225 [Steroidobacteraceae bacterium]
MKRLLSTIPLLVAIAVAGYSAAQRPEGTAFGAQQARPTPVMPVQGLPEGHPPVEQWMLQLPEGHPPLPRGMPDLPEGHPPIPGYEGDCPAPHDGMGRGDGATPDAVTLDPPAQVST